MFSSRGSVRNVQNEAQGLVWRPWHDTTLNDRGRRGEPVRVGEGAERPGREWPDRSRRKAEARLWLLLRNPPIRRCFRHDYDGSWREH
jgi:hypothetical protein